MTEPTAPAATTAEPADLPGTFAQFLAFLGGSTAYAVHLMLGAALVPLACEIGTTWPIHGLSILALGTIGWSSLVGLRIRRLTAGPTAEDDLEEAPDELPVLVPVARRARYLANVGLLLNVLSAVIVLFVEVHAHTLDPCLPAA